MPDTTSPSFEAARQVLVGVAEYHGQDVAAWIAMAEAAGGLVDADGRSHLAALIRNDKRILRGWWGRAEAHPAVRDIDALARASLTAGWRVAKDGSALIEAALRRGSPEVLEWVANIAGIPDPAGWDRIGVPALNASGTSMHAKPHLPAPCAWAALERGDLIAGLEWWIRRGLPLSTRVLDHASPTTLPLLLDAGLLADGAVLEAWQARTHPNAVQPLSAQALAGMLDRLAQTQPADAGVKAEKVRAGGERVLDILRRHYFDAEELGVMLDQWHQAGGAESAWPPLVDGRGSLWLCKIDVPVPWWARALVACMGSDTSMWNLSVVFKCWDRMAGAAPRFHPDTPEQAREAMLGFALWSAWAIAGAEENGTLRMGDYGQVTRRSAAHAHAFVRQVMAWAGLDEAGAGRCLGRTLALVGRRVRGGARLGTRLEIGVKALLIETLGEDAAMRPDGRTDCAALLGVLEAPLAARGIIGPGHLSWLSATFSPANAGGLSSRKVDDTDRLRIGLGLLAGMEDVGVAVNDPLFGHLLGLMGRGVRVGEGALPEVWKDRPAVLALLAQGGLQGGNGGRRPRRRS